MSTDEKDDLPPPELTAFDGDAVPVYDLSDLDGDDEESAAQHLSDLVADDEETPVHDLGADTDEELLVHDLVADEEPTAHDLGTEDDDVPITDLEDDDDDDKLPVHDLGTDGDDPGVLVGDIQGSKETPSVHSLDTEGDTPAEGTEDGSVPVFDLSSNADRQAVLAEALAHAALQEAQYTQPLSEARRTGLWKTPLAFVVFSLSAYLLAFPAPWLAGGDPPSVSQTAREHGVRAALFLQAQQIEVFRVRQGRLPNGLEEVEGALGGIQFVRSNNRVFQLVAPGPDGTSIIYDSSRPIDEFVAAAAGWGMDQP